MWTVCAIQMIDHPAGELIDVKHHCRELFREAPRQILSK